MVPVKNLGDLRWYSGLYYERDIDRGTIKISQQTYAEELAKDYGVVNGKSIPCLLYTSPSPRDKRQSRMPSSA